MNMINPAALDRAVKIVMGDVLDVMRAGSRRTYWFLVEARRSMIVSEYHRQRLGVTIDPPISYSWSRDAIS